MKAHAEVASRLAKLAEGQVRALDPGRPLLARDDQSGLFHLRLGVQETGDLQTWQKLPIGAGEAVIKYGDLIFSFIGTEPNRFYRIDAGELGPPAPVTPKGLACATARRGTFRPA